MPGSRQPIFDYGRTFGSRRGPSIDHPRYSLRPPVVWAAALGNPYAILLVEGFDQFAQVKH